MDIFAFYILVLIILFLIMAGIVWLAYWLPKRFGHKKLGKILSRVVAIGFALIILGFIFDDHLFFKSDATKNLTELNVELRDDFKILSNQDGGLMDYYHSFVLEISENDKRRLIRQIESKPDFRDSIQNERHLPSESESRYYGDTLRANYKTDWAYKTEIYYSNGKGYTPTYKIVSISKSKNELTFEHILD